MLEGDRECFVNLFRQTQCIPSLKRKGRWNHIVVDATVHPCLVKKCIEHTVSHKSPSLSKQLIFLTTSSNGMLHMHYK